MNVSEFYNSDYVDYACYSTLRALASSIDGQKNSGRKILKTVLDKKIINEIKVSQLASKMAEYTEYLHGDASGPIVTMAQNYVGTNNISLLHPEGNFGTRFKNEASAPRYIYTYGTDELFKMFNGNDKEILVKQYFEGDEIEPKFYLPSLPVLLINGAQGPATGFAQKILPRSEVAIEKFLIKALKSGKRSTFNLDPHYNGFLGEVRQGEEKHKWEILGVINRKSASKVDITELPIGYELKKYIKILDDLEDKGVITGYIDKSDDNKFNFELQFKIADLKKLTDEQLLTKLKLVNKQAENYTAIDENNKVKVFKNSDEIFWYYYDVKMNYLQKRKDFIINKITNDIYLDVSKYIFIKAIVDEKLIINKRKKSVIEKDLEKIDKIIKKDDSYNYLLSMPIYSLTKEKLDALTKEIKDKKAKLVAIKKQTLESIWMDDLK